MFGRRQIARFNELMLEMLACHGARRSRRGGWLLNTRAGLLDLSLSSGWRQNGDSMLDVFICFREPARARAMVPSCGYSGKWNYHIMRSDLVVEPQKLTSSEVPVHAVKYVSHGLADVGVIPFPTPREVVAVVKAAVEKWLLARGLTYPHVRSQIAERRQAALIAMGSGSPYTHRRYPGALDREPEEHAPIQCASDED